MSLRDRLHVLLHGQVDGTDAYRRSRRQGPRFAVPFSYGRRSPGFGDTRSAEDAVDQFESPQEEEREEFGTEI